MTTTETTMDLRRAARVALMDCMACRPGERTLIVADAPMRQVAEALWAEAVAGGCDALLVEIIPRSANGEEPPANVALLMERSEVVLCATSRSLTHTEARRNAANAGARVATLPGVTPEIMVRCMNADYGKIAERTTALCRLMEKTSVVTVTAPAGTQITMPVKGRKALASSGILRESGQWGNLPTGEAYCAPIEGLSDGIVVVDGSMAGVGMVTTPIRIAVKNGYAEEISGGTEAEKLRALLDKHGRDARNVAEFGIGTNDRAILSGNIIEDEKVMGTIHIAFGDNKSMGGSVGVSSHLDGLIRRPTVSFDGTVVMKDGVFVPGMIPA